MAFAQDASDPDELLHLARERARHGDYEGVRIVAGEALEIPGEHQRTARYLVAMSWEFGGDPARALGLYDALLADRPDDDVRFRRAECLGRLGRYAEARDELGRIGHLRDRPDVDRRKVGLLEGIWTLEVGKVRPGSKQIARELEAAAPGEATYYQAAARHAILVHATTTADALAFVGSDRAKAKALEQRAELIALAEAQLAELVRLGEPTFALDGFRLVGRTYEDLGADMLAESPLDKLTPEQQRINRELLVGRVEKVWVKGTMYYDRGLQYARIEDWTAEPVATITAGMEALQARVEGLATAE